MTASQTRMRLRPLGAYKRTAISPQVGLLLGRLEPLVSDRFEIREFPDAAIRLGERW
jgi:hypothetical protein